MPINDYFQKAVCINLDRRPDRLQESQQQWNKHNLKVERVSATDGNPMNWKHESERRVNLPNVRSGSFPGVAGCISSHTKIWRDAKEEGLDNVLIIEDDCDFVEDLQYQFNEKIKEVPDDWDLLYFGGVHETRGGVYMPETISKNVVKCARMITTTCYAINTRIVDMALDIVFETEPYFHTAIDGYLGAYIQAQCNAYAFHPTLAWQRGSFSDIQQGHRDYSLMMKNSNIKN